MRVFMSYAAERRAAAEPIAFSLRDRGFDVFLDRDDLPDGKSYDARIEEGIATSDLFVFLISPESVTPGRYTLTEVEFARQKWRKADGCVLPVLIAQTDPASIPSFLKSVNILEPVGNAAAEVSSRVAAMVRPPPARRIMPAAIALGIVTGLLGAFVELPIADIPKDPDGAHYVIHYKDMAPLSAPLFYALGFGLFLKWFERSTLGRLFLLVIAVFAGWLVAINIFLRVVGLNVGENEDATKVRAIIWLATGVACGAAGALFTWLGAATAARRLFRLEVAFTAILIGALAGCLLYPSYAFAEHYTWLLFCGWQAAVTAAIAWCLSQTAR
jgi:hypothetical protein